MTDFTAQAEELHAENERLNIGMFEMRLVLESQDLRLHRYHEALEKIAAEHEKQASAWADGGEPDHAQWHRRLAKIAKEALK